MTVKYRDLTGQQFGRLKVIRIFGRNKDNDLVWICQCVCSKITHVTGHHLRSGDIQSCGCSHTKHGLSHAREYRVWANMKARCDNTKEPNYKYYGARGITYCEKWKKFENFYNDMGKCPSNKHSIERVDVDGNYEPSNCIWETQKIQQNNRRSNRKIKFKGEWKTLAQWCDLYNADYCCVWVRLKSGWSIENALTKSKQWVNLTFEGKTKSLTQWARDCELNLSTLRMRLFKYNWTVKRALTTPVITKHRKAKQCNNTNKLIEGCMFMDEEEQ